MSHKAAQWVLNDAPVTDATALLVLHGLADHANPDGEGAYPSRETLARYARCSVRSVSVKLKVLEDGGVILRGDQELVSHIRADRRPTVWNLNYDVQILHPVGSGYDDEQMPARRADEDEVQTPSPGEDERGADEGSTGCRTESNDVQVPAHKPTTNQILNPISSSPSVSTSPADGAISHEDLFEKWWKLYPKSENKPRTLTAYQNAYTILTANGSTAWEAHDILLEGVKGYLRKIKTDNIEHQFVKYSFNWLGEKRWEDEYPKPKRRERGWCEVAE